jgi:hypothetical protein
MCIVNIVLVCRSTKRPKQQKEQEKEATKELESGDHLSSGTTADVWSLFQGEPCYIFANILLVVPRHYDILSVLLQGKLSCFITGKDVSLNRNIQDDIAALGYCS